MVTVKKCSRDRYITCQCFVGFSGTGDYDLVFVEITVRAVQIGKN